MATRNTKCMKQRGIIKFYWKIKKISIKGTINIPCTSMGGFSTEKKPIPPKLFWRFRKIPVKFLVEARVCVNVYGCVHQWACA